MKNLCRQSKRLMSCAVAAFFIAQQTLLSQSMASNITGVQGNNGVYNINPTAIISNSDIGLRKYENFTLSQGDIANLIYKYGAKDVNTFLNLVDNTIKIDGIVNTMRDGNFYNARAIFVSPKGMVVGASGVLNVGSLGVYTPNSDVYNKYKNNPSKDFTSLSDKNNTGEGAVQIKGHVFATKDIDMVSGKIHVSGKMLAGTGNASAYDSTKRAEDIFNSLVNTSNISSANNMTLNNGVISLTSTKGTAVMGDVKNVGSGDVNITNYGSSGIHVSGNLSNSNGNMYFTNSAGSVYGAKTANIENSAGTFKVVNTGDGIRFVPGSSVKNNGTLLVTNTGKNGIELGANFSNTGNATVDNKAGFLSVSGNFSNNGNTTFTNNGSQLNINGSVVNKGGKLALTNSGNQGVHVVSTGGIQSQGLDIVNTGRDGVDIHGKIVNSGDFNINDSKEGVRGISVYKGGSVENTDGNINFYNEGEIGLNIYGKLSNTNGNTKLVNYGSRGLNVTSTGTVDTRGVYMENNGDNGLHIYGTVNNVGDGQYVSNKGTLDINETGKMSNKGGSATYYNNGVNGFVVSGEINNEGSTIVKNDNGYLAVGGKYSNVGNSTFTNNGKQLNIYGTMENTKGRLVVNNTSDDSIYVVSTGKITADHVNITNSGKKKITFNGKIVSDDINITDKGR